MAENPKPKLNEHAIRKLEELAEIMIALDDEEGYSLQLLLEWHARETGI
jgi:hypothetical protein